MDRRQLPQCSFSINICVDFLWKTHLGQKWKSSYCLPFVRASNRVMFCPKSGRVCLSQVHFPWFTSARALGYHTLINDVSWCWTSWTFESRRDGKNAAGRLEFSFIFSFLIFVGAGEKVQKDILFHTLINDIRISWSWTSWTSCIKESEISEKKVLLVDIQRRENLEHCREMYLSGGPTWSWTRNFLVSLDAFHLKLCWCLLSACGRCSSKNTPCRDFLLFWQNSVYNLLYQI